MNRVALALLAALLAVALFLVLGPWQEDAVPGDGEIE